MGKEVVIIGAKLGTWITLRPFHKGGEPFAGT